ncbi:SAM-dependent methyltransferase [Nitrospirillum pindoramense]|uniref:23S rRNA (Cytidine2498-2'-O)-methyltransferase n=1 Tax=Nitrospirillum amazonense TaxID=28077 RepID=A0A560HEH5_9PROT|nr:SAM-dependent methyltransferase [Nitrospirillum amazonense]TWB44441.1 23S rRNA (cytidine2498-2'-O)-methyltransferase [Nitrospirillum amazonense]
MTGHPDETNAPASTAPGAPSFDGAAPPADIGAAYLAAEGFLEPLLEELDDSSAIVHGRLVITQAPPRAAAWSLNTWLSPRRIAISSIKDGARALRGIQRNWAVYEHGHHRRSRLIQEQLPHVSAKPLVFPSPAPTAPLGAWTLLDEHTILASPACSSAFANGEVTFVEDKATPPNRAYLKLWEALTLAGRMPGPGDRCLDLGACPGGWTWVLQSLGAEVTAIDKAPLDPRIASLPRVTVRRESAFGLEPATIGPVDWLCSDVICYPERLLRLVRQWKDGGHARNFICTLKFQGETDHVSARAFAAIPGSRLLHLSHNKHELTWIYLAPEASAS